MSIHVYAPPRIQTANKKRKPKPIFDLTPVFVRCMHAYEERQNCCPYKDSPRYTHPHTTRTSAQRQPFNTPYGATEKTLLLSAVTGLSRDRRGDESFASRSCPYLSNTLAGKSFPFSPDGKRGQLVRAHSNLPQQQKRSRADTYPTENQNRRTC